MFTQLVKTIETFKQHNEPPIQQQYTYKRFTVYIC